MPGGVLRSFGMFAFLGILNYRDLGMRSVEVFESGIAPVASEVSADSTLILIMTTHFFSAVSLRLRIGLVAIAALLLLATSVAAQQTPSISVSDALVVEGNAGTTPATFTVSLSGVSSQTVTCSFNTANGTATAGSDYVAASGALSFAPGETQKQVVVQVNGDTVDETQETFFLDISNVTNATVNNNRGTAFINDDDGPTISINDVSIIEGNAGTKTATFTLTLSAA